PQRAVLAGRVRSSEDPVLPGRQPTEDLGFHRLRTGEPVVRFKAGQCVRTEAGPLLDRDTYLVLPVDVVGRERDQPEPLRLRRHRAPRAAPPASGAPPACSSTAASPSGSPRNLVASLLSPLPIGSAPRFSSPSAIEAGSPGSEASSNTPSSM